MDKRARSVACETGPRTMAPAHLIARQIERIGVGGIAGIRRAFSVWDVPADQCTRNTTGNSGERSISLLMLLTYLHSYDIT